MGALAASIWVPCVLLGVLAGSIWLPCALLGAIWVQAIAQRLLQRRDLQLEKRSPAQQNAIWVPESPRAHPACSIWVPESTLRALHA